MFDLIGKVALVTGARRGMGKAHALALARQGAQVAVTDVDEKECEVVVEEIKKSGGEAAAFRLDVSEGREVDSVFGETIKKFGRLDILVNNAGIYFSKPALLLSEEDWDKMLSVNQGSIFVRSTGGAGNGEKQMGTNYQHCLRRFRPDRHRHSRGRALYGIKRRHYRHERNACD